jgi:alpha-tubulin suppressor-like RCC1 family protein
MSKKCQLYSQPSSKGQFGDDTIGTSTSKLNRVDLSSIPSSASILEIECGFKHTVILTNENKVYAWGDNTLYSFIF